MDAGVLGSTLFKGACLLPGTPISRVFSGELYIPKTSARASLVLIVTVGSAPPIKLFRFMVRVDLCPSSLKSIGIESGEGRENSDGNGGPHFLPKRPSDRARASWILYSTLSSVNKSERLNRSFSGRFPGSGGASMYAYLDSGVEVTGFRAEDGVVAEEEEEETERTWLE